MGCLFFGPVVLQVKSAITMVHRCSKDVDTIKF